MRLILKIVCGILVVLSTQNTLAQTPADTAQIITKKVHIPQLNRDRTIRIYLPAGYITSTRKYPVIYMHDAQNIYSGTKNPANSWYVDLVLKTYPAKKQAIIVGINNSPRYRINEYNAYNSSYGKGEGDAYIQFIIKYLKPHIDSNYRTEPAAKYTAIVGSSMGGLISMYAAVKYPEEFGVAGVLSPSFWIAPQIYTDASAQKPDKKQRYFLAYGDKEGNENEYVNKMDTLLRGKGFSLKNVPAPLIIKDGKHNELQWRKVFVVFYAWFINGL